VYRAQPDLSAQDSFIFIEISAKDLPNFNKFLWQKKAPMKHQGF